MGIRIKVRLFLTLCVWLCSAQATTLREKLSNQCRKELVDIKVFIFFSFSFTIYCTSRRQNVTHLLPNSQYVHELLSRQKSTPFTRKCLAALSS
jgi:hypothetical protein